MEKLKAINKITKQCTSKVVEQDVFILPDLGREKVNNYNSSINSDLYPNTRYPSTPLILL